jgi:predicted metalloprotease
VVAFGLPSAASAADHADSSDLSLPGAAAAAGSRSTDLDGTLTAILTDVDAYWTRVFEANDLGEPTVRYAWIPAGSSVRDGCTGQATDPTAAFYCPNDDTIYLNEGFAAAVRDGRLRGWPSGDQPSEALGDMAMAYVIAHEEAHNIQAELGVFDGPYSTPQIELHADCLAGAWAKDAADRDVVNADDVERALATAWLVGDYAVHDPGHHGTPEQRHDALMTGYEDLSGCRAYLQ